MYPCVEKWQIKFTIHWLELWLLKETLKQEMLNFEWTFRPAWWTCDLKVDIFVSEPLLTVCQQQRIGTGRYGKINQFRRTRRSKEHRRKKKGVDELSFPSTERISCLLTTPPPISFRLCNPYTRWRHSPLLTVFDCSVLNQFHFQCHTQRKNRTWNDLWYDHEYRGPNSDSLCIVIKTNGPLLLRNMGLNMFLFEILPLGRFSLLSPSLLSLKVYEKEMQRSHNNQK